MKFSLLLLFPMILTLSLQAETNTSAEAKAPQKKEKKEPLKQSTETNASKKKLLEQKIKEQMEREKKYAKEQKFYQGDAYDLKSHEVDPNSLPDVPTIEPDYDFDITDVYRDDI